MKSKSNQLTQLENQILYLNNEAMKLLSKGKLRESKELLDNAISVISEANDKGSPSKSMAFSSLSNKLFGMTYNNMGCLFKAYSSL